jgi:hypothetical protein
MVVMEVSVVVDVRKRVVLTASSGPGSANEMEVLAYTMLKKKMPMKARVVVVMRMVRLVLVCGRLVVVG